MKDMKRPFKTFPPKIKKNSFKTRLKDFQKMNKI